MTADPPQPHGALVLITGATALYAPAPEGGTAVFLLGSATDPPPQLLPGEIWSDTGAPAHPGWFVFLAEPVGGSGAQQVETELRAVLAAREATGFAWADRQGNIMSVVDTELDASGSPRIAGDATLPVPVGMLALSFPKDAPLSKVDEDGMLQAIACGVPAGVAPGAPTGPGASVQVTGPAAGCVTFDAFVGDPPGSGATVVLMAVSIDPLRPFDPKRSYRRFTGARFGFAPHGEGWQLAALEGSHE